LTNNNYTVKFRNFESVAMWAMPIAAMIDSGESRFSDFATNQSWLDELRAQLLTAKVPEDSANPFGEIIIVESAYTSSPDRGTADTLKILELRKMMPLRFSPQTTSPKNEGNGLSWAFDRISLSPGGAVSFRYKIMLDSGSALSVVDLNTAYLIALRAAREDLTKQAQKLFEICNNHIANVRFKVILPDSLEPYLLTYEAIDTDIDVLDDTDGTEVRIPIKKMYTQNYQDVVRQLAAMSRMTTVVSAYYDWDRLTDFRRADIGNREDEMWLINSGRMVRSHPDRDDPDMRDYYEDAVLLAEILLQYRASISYVDHWLREAKRSLRSGSIALELEGDQSGAKDDIQSHRNIEDQLGQVILGVERLGDHLADPTELLLGIRNPSFRSLADSLTTAMQVNTAVQSGQRAVTQFLSIAESTYSQGLALGQRQAERTNRRLTWASLVAAVAAALAAVTSCIATFQLQDTSSNMIEPATEQPQADDQQTGSPEDKSQE